MLWYTDKRQHHPSTPQTVRAVDPNHEGSPMPVIDILFWSSLAIYSGWFAIAGLVGARRYAYPRLYLRAAIALGFGVSCVLRLIPVTTDLAKQISLPLLLLLLIINLSDGRELQRRGITLRKLLFFHTM
jgi:hypothetical protein